MPKRKPFLDEGLHHLSQVLKQAGLFFSGLAALSLFFFFVLLSIPVYLYRLILSELVVPLYFRGRIGRPVTSTGNIFATELSVQGRRPPRCAIVSSFVLEGTISDEEVSSTILDRWLRKRDPQGHLVYPEFTQFIEQWLGFMFWKPDPAFELHNHLHFHVVPEEGDLPSEQFVTGMMEDLLNKPFPPWRSPWELHVIRNYRNSQLPTIGEGEPMPMTVFLLRVHHALADGFSLLYAILNGLFGMPLSTITLPIADNPKPPSDKSLLSYLKFPLRLIHDFGFFSSLAYRPRSPWHVSDRKKSWRQLYARSELIPLSNLKEVKNKLGVSFTGVLLSSVSAGVAKSLHKRKGMKPIDNMAALIPLPLANHPKKLVNHVAGTIFDLPVGPNLTSMERLLQTEKNLQSAKQSTLPWFGVIYAKLLGSHLAPVARRLCKNSVIPLGLSNFPGPANQILWNGRRGLAADFAAGAVNGVAGVGFMVLSYGDFIRIAATAESAVMSRDSLTKLIQFVTHEINLLRLIPSKSSPSD